MRLRLQISSRGQGKPVEDDETEKPMNPPVSAPAVKIVKSVREQVSPEEWDARVNLAAAYRLVAMYG
jgi:hypothetical protein